MNTKLLPYVLLGLACLVSAAPLASYAQGTLYLSHLGSNADTGLGVQSDEWNAISFETGPDAGGYTLDSLQLRFAGIAGTPAGFALSVYSDNAGLPGGSLGLLSGSDPTGVGIFTFTTPGITLAPSTTYWAVATQSDPALSGNSFYWAFDPNSAITSDGWSLGVDASSVSGSGDWFSSASGSPLTLAIDASPTPEPKTYSLIGVGLVSLLLLRRKQRRNFDSIIS